MANNYIGSMDPRDKKRPCLKCDKPFMTVPEIRICGDCKEKLRPLYSSPLNDITHLDLYFNAVKHGAHAPKTSGKTKTVC
jgi:hypothetical protein